MARRSNYGFEKRQKEKLKREKKQKKLERKLEKKESEANGEAGEDPSIAPIDPADLGLDD
ncbi:MAG TPA: hypothetical protein VKA86_00910 [Candidatus Krumholzibacteria bacterium]|jgi:hypothetical protein|nr:hypothetical protein [Candidatus Krumholzibacteria bacterium]